MTRLLLDVSGHGFGHLVQSAPVVNELARAVPGLTLTVRTNLPAHLLDERLEVAYDRVAEAPDPGLAMTDALTVDRAGSFARYQAFHHQWLQSIAAEARWLSQREFDLVLADVPYRSLAGATASGIPAVALCSLNWGGVFHHYLGDRSGADAIHKQIRDAYRKARLFIQPEPHMPMRDLINRQEVGPVAPRPPEGISALRQRLAGDRRLGLVTLGGIPFPLTPSDWREDPETLWLVDGAGPGRPDQRDLHEADAAPLDLLAASDIVVTKPGYGTFVEAACQGVDVLYLPRGDWPEELYLMDWIHRHTRAGRLSWRDLVAGRFGPMYEALGTLPRPERPCCDGAREAAAKLMEQLA
ncbi:hypothetical protein [Thiohalorhabdus sp.]|uniref:hypothetical protein n=1 Tax=Thiohalorhabdus sp. TaxID=3094134 RepID=UPI002FC2CCF2